MRLYQKVTNKFVFNWVHPFRLVPDRRVQRDWVGRSWCMIRLSLFSHYFLIITHYYSLFTHCLLITYWILIYHYLLVHGKTLSCINVCIHTCIFHAHVCTHLPLTIEWQRSVGSLKCIKSLFQKSPSKIGLFQTRPDHLDAYQLLWPHNDSDT